MLVYLRVHLGILDSLWHVFDADHFLCLVSHEIDNGSGTGIEVINQLVCR